MKKLLILFTIPLLLATLSAHADKPLPEVWEVGDGEGGTFLIKLFEGNLARTNYSKGDNGFLGEVGYWHRHDNVITILYDSGWADSIIKNDDGSYTKHGYSPISSLKAEPSNTSAAKQVINQPLFAPVSEENFVGVWKLDDENGDTFYLITKPDRTARSSYSGGKEGVFGETGVWRHEGNRITIVYNSGWVDIIVFGDGKFKKYAYAPGHIMAGKFDNTSSAEKVAPKEAGITQ
ncbi:hypothetical protein [Cerasicoccus maritimus]|uniref:hypothetical protein n=1 Tax=Cerasicoccus maritimus TaxID=490089 RepID=UPI002852A38F|nr:hypothetical protein [Cerasicoccus maritimus]